MLRNADSDPRLRTCDRDCDAVAAGYPDWFLFRRGRVHDTFDSPIVGGRSEKEPMVIAAYGPPDGRAGHHRSGAGQAGRLQGQRAPYPEPALGLHQGLQDDVDPHGLLRPRRAGGLVGARLAGCRVLLGRPRHALRGGLPLGLRPGRPADLPAPQNVVPPLRRRLLLAGPVAQPGLLHQRVQLRGHLRRRHLLPQRLQERSADGGRPAPRHLQPQHLRGRRRADGPPLPGHHHRRRRLRRPADAAGRAHREQPHHRGLLVQRHRQQQGRQPLADGRRPERAVGPGAGQRAARLRLPHPERSGHARGRSPTAARSPPSATRSRAPRSARSSRATSSAGPC